MQTYSLVPRPLYSPSNREPTRSDYAAAGVALSDRMDGMEPQADVATDPTPRTGFLTMADLLFWLGVESSPNSLANVQATFRRSAMRARVYDVQEAVDAMVDRLLGLELENSKFTSIDHAVRSVIAFSKKCVSKNGDWILPCIAFRKATRPSRSLKKPVSDPRAPADPARIVEACENRPGMLEILVGTGADRLPTGAIVEIAGGDSYCRSHYGRRQGRAVQYAPCSVRE